MAAILGLKMVTILAIWSIINFNENHTTSFNTINFNIYSYLNITWIYFPSYNHILFKRRPYWIPKLAAVLTQKYLNTIFSKYIFHIHILSSTHDPKIFLQHLIPSSHVNFTIMFFGIPVIVVQFFQMIQVYSNAQFRNSDHHHKLLKHPVCTKNLSLRTKPLSRAPKTFFLHIR